MMEPADLKESDHNLESLDSLLLPSLRSMGFSLDSAETQALLARIRKQDENELRVILAKRHLDIPMELALDEATNFKELEKWEAECQTCNHAPDKVLSCGRTTVVYDGKTLSFPVVGCPFAKQIRQQVMYQKALKSMLISSRFQNRTFDTFHVTEATQAVYQFARQWAENFHEHAKGYYIFGDFGSGKTHLAVASLLEVHRLHDITGAFLVCADFLEELKAKFKDPDGLKQTFELYAKAPLLVIDDLGEGRKEKDGTLSGWANEQLFRLINYRYEFELTTIITSTLNPSRLLQVVTPSVASRLPEMCSFLHNRATDYRVANINVIG